MTKNEARVLSVDGMTLAKIVSRLQLLAKNVRKASMEAGRWAALVMANPTLVPEGTKPIQYLADKTHWGTTSLRRFARIYGQADVRKVYLAGTDAVRADRLVSLHKRNESAGVEAIAFAAKAPNANDQISAKIIQLNDELDKRERHASLEALFAQHPDDAVRQAMRFVSAAVQEYEAAKDAFDVAQNVLNDKRAALDKAEQAQAQAQETYNRFELRAESAKVVKT